MADILKGAVAAGGVARLERFVLRSSLVTDEGVRILVQTMAAHKEGMFSRLRGLGLHLGETVLMSSAGPVDRRDEKNEMAWAKALLEGAEAAAGGHGHDWASSITDLCTRQVYVVHGIFNKPTLFPQLRRLDVVGKEDSHKLWTTLGRANQCRECPIVLEKIPGLYIPKVTTQYRGMRDGWL